MIKLNSDESILQNILVIYGGSIMMNNIYDESSEITNDQIYFLMNRKLDFEKDLFESLTKKVLNMFGYPPELEVFIQPYKQGTRKGFYRWSLNKAFDESDVICYIYSYYNEKSMEYIFEEYWNVG